MVKFALRLGTEYYKGMTLQEFVLKIQNDNEKLRKSRKLLLVVMVMFAIVDVIEGYLYLTEEVVRPKDTLFLIFWMVVTVLYYIMYLIMKQKEEIMNDIQNYLVPLIKELKGPKKEA